MVGYGIVRSDGDPFPSRCSRGGSGFEQIVSDSEIRVGLCGFSMAQAGYPRRFPVVEIQHPFYQPPAAAVHDRWRKTMTDGYEFTIKAWQLITHTAASPTYRRLRRVLTEDERAGAGAFRDSAFVAEAWCVTCECAARVRATAILFQCPARFTPTPPHLTALRAFFARIDRPAGVNLLFEPRGPAWTPAIGRAVSDEIGAVHVVDPFVTPPVARSEAPLRYFRLHGIGGASHVNNEGELAELAEFVFC